MYNIIICDDEKDIVSALKIYLTSEDYAIFEAFNGKEALDILQKNEIHLILMDIMMPIMDGMAAMVEIRKTSNVPIIFLTAKGEDTDKILGLNVGADDYITKPFNPMEVCARVKSQLRRYTRLGSNIATANLIKIGNIEIDSAAKTVTVDDEIKNLTPTEFEILRLLAQNAGKVFSSKEIYYAIWKDSPYGAENTVAVHVRHIREKIEINPAEPRFIKVVWGQGYKIERGITV